MDISQILGWTATVLFSVMLIPQMMKTIRMKDTTGVSLSLFINYLMANIIEFLYAFLIEKDPLLIKYFIATVTAVIYICIYVNFRKKKGEK